MTTQTSAANYSSSDFWDKAGKYAKTAGKAVLGNSLKMYYSADDKDTPTWAKTTIFTALAYFVCPVDAIPDITPLIGYTDDATVLTAAVATTAAHIKEEHVERSKKTLKRWFG